MFGSVVFDPDRYQRDMQIALPRKEYVIFFTPRSASSWLTNALKASRRLGDPDELFNPGFVPKIAASYNARDIRSYIDMARRKRSPGGVFGFEITYFQMLSTFGSVESYLQHFPPSTRSIWLVREDIVEQAVSLAKAVATGIYHSAATPEDHIVRADSEFEYDPASINRWLGHILEQETATEQLLAANHIHPLRLTYETMMADKQGTINAICEHLGEPPTTLEANSHRKIGTDKNAEFAERFARENPTIIRHVDEMRAPTLSPGRPSLSPPWLQHA